MPETIAYSIDQNCHPLWDVVPKLQALQRKGWAVRHLLEDVDVAFTAMGAGVDDASLRLARERFHRSGGQDWGAALFYSEFLGRLPVEIRDWESHTGMKTAALARQLARSVDDLYDAYSPSDNWQLIGSSYVGDREHHRVVGDLTVQEAAPFLAEMLDAAGDDMLRAFPAGDARRRTRAWFEAERARLDALIATHREGTLAGLYRDWLAAHVGDGVQLAMASRELALGAEPDETAILDLFLRDYDAACELYNRAIEQTRSPVHPLAQQEGELPFFAILAHQGHAVRTAVRLDGDRLILPGREIPLRPDRRAPVGALHEAGVRCMPAKALLLTLQVRLAPRGRALALPHRGSLYLPAALRLAGLLGEAGLLRGELKPVVRVRLHLLDRLGELDTPLRLPEHLARATGCEELPARRLGEIWAQLQAEASDRLGRLRDDAGRRAWQRETMGDLHQAMDRLDARRRELAGDNPKDPALRGISQEVRSLQAQVLGRTLEQIAVDWQVADLDYWDSRGAILPWSLALGGEAFYNSVLDRAEVYEEPQAEAPGREG